ncbi:pectin lyase-like protein [Schizopora paradoxa]|uniref:Pectinesterase n=1 Tax=Schizopora paradoxa TaxID=27342 RepID=A0A0H2S8N2_9AGAM|nr:pectin lyase-like protein [Schizopora paradoxa]
MLLPLFYLILAGVQFVHGASRTTPPAGAVVVKAGTTTSEEFADVVTAVNALPNDDSTQTIFIFPGTYEGQVNISRPGPTKILGYTTDTMDFNQNVAVLAHSASLATSTSDDTTGTLRIHSNNVALYNIDVRNDFGVAETNGQAIALSNYGSNFGAYASRFFSYQDTLLAEQGTQVYLKSYIEGAVDFIFGQKGQAFFQGNTIASKGAGCVTASGRSTNDSTMYVFDQNTLVAAPDAFSNVTDKTFLGRPWEDFAKVIFKNTVINTPLNNTIWSIWNVDEPNTDHVFFAEFNSTGPGVAGAMRPPFSTLLTSEEAAAYNIASTVGSDYTSWVDASYL